jgi:hypothetical protein
MKGKRDKVKCIIDLNIFVSGVYWIEISRILKDFYEKKVLWHSIKTFTKVKKILWYLIKTIKIFFSGAIKSVGNQLRFLITFKMSIAIQKSIDFNGFSFEMNFERLFS